jgi:hypothetical protein
VQAAQRERAGRGALRTLALLSGAAVLGLAFATPARAEDQPPLMLAKSAVIAPDEPDITIAADTETPPSVDVAPPVPDPVPTKAVAIDGWELAAKPQHRHTSARVHTTPRPVISTPVRAPHRNRPHHARKAASRPRQTRPAAWYQVKQQQYRQVRAHGLNRSANPVAPSAQAGHVDIVAPRPAELQTQRTICALRAQKCLQLCGVDASYTVSRNERWIRVCIATSYAAPRLDRLHALLLQRLWSVARDTANNASATQYQCLWAQYQSEQRKTCHHEVRRQPPEQKAAQIKAPVALRVVHVEPRGRVRVLAAVATRERPQVQAAAPPQRQKPRGVTVVAPATERGGSASSDDWLLRSLVALIGIAMLALLLTAAVEVPRAGAAFTSVRSRLASKGLSSSRIDLGTGRAPRRRSGGIAYRD